VVNDIDPPEGTNLTYGLNLTSVLAVRPLGVRRLHGAAVLALAGQGVGALLLLRRRVLSHEDVLIRARAHGNSLRFVIGLTRPAECVTRGKQKSDGSKLLDHGDLK
jgi:hypothetical protein